MAIKLTIYGLDWPKLVAKMSRILHDPFDLKHNEGASWYQEARILTLQSMTLQVTFDSTIIAIHRPLIELGMGGTAQTPPELTREDVSRSMHAAVEAAIRTSKVAIEAYEKEQPVAYILLACLTASVLLCIPPIHEPMSERAHRSKEGILRIIHACKNLSAGVPLAENIYGLLSSLMKAVVDRETSAALATGNMQPTGDQSMAYHSHSGDGPHQHPFHSSQAHFDANQVSATHAISPNGMEAERSGRWMPNLASGQTGVFNQEQLMPSPQTYQMERPQAFLATAEEACRQVAGPSSTSPSSLFSLLPQESGRGWHWPSVT